MVRISGRSNPSGVQKYLGRLRDQDLVGRYGPGRQRCGRAFSSLGWWRRCLDDVFDGPLDGVQNGSRLRGSIFVNQLYGICIYNIMNIYIYIYIYQHLPKGFFLDPRDGVWGTRYHPFSTLWKIQVLIRGYKYILHTCLGYIPMMDP